MPHLVIAGRTIPVAPDGGLQSAPIDVGADSTTYNGTSRSTVKAQKLVWQFTSKGVLPAVHEDLKSATALGALVACSGDGLGDGLTSYTCRVRIGDVTYRFIKGTYQRIMPLTLTQV
jgi:hypothetical protein